MCVLALMRPIVPLPGLFRKFRSRIVARSERPSAASIRVTARDFQPNRAGCSNYKLPLYLLNKNRCIIYRSSKKAQLPTAVQIGRGPKFESNRPFLDTQPAPFAAMSAPNPPVLVEFLRNVNLRAAWRALKAKTAGGLHLSRSRKRPDATRYKRASPDFI